MALVVGAVIDYQCHENPHRIDEAEPGMDLACLSPVS
jgi:hypothetical protein